MSWSGIFSEKQSGSVYDRIRQLASSTVIFIAVIALFSVFFITFSDRSYQRNMISLSCVIEFYDALSGLDKDVFSYAGTGDEMVYGKIWDEIITERGMLADLAQQYEGFYIHRMCWEYQGTCLSVRCDDNFRKPAAEQLLSVVIFWCGIWVLNLLLILLGATVPTFPL